MKSDSNSKVLFTGPFAAPPRLAEAVSDAIAAALFDGRIAPGEPLPSEGEIATGFSVSKPIAREALRQLSNAGLVHTQQGKVARAKALSGESVDRIYGLAARSSLKRLMMANEMRMVIEVGIAQLAARRLSKDGLAEMEQALAAMDASIGNPAAFTDADIAFHHGMGLATGNEMLRIQVEGMRSVQREVSELFARRSNRSESDWRETVVRHREIFRAITENDRAACERAIVVHYDAANIASLDVAGRLGGGDG